MVEPRILAAGLDHPEGVCWHPDGVLYAGGEAGQIYRVGLDGMVTELARTGGFVLGLATDGAHTLYACDAVRRVLLSIDLRTNDVNILTAGAPGHPLRAPNMVAVSGEHLYLTDSGRFGERDGAVLRVGRDGTTEVWSRQASDFPNGCALTPDGTALLVVESTRPGVVRIPIGEDGTAGVPVELARLDGCVPDGVAVAASGAAYVSCYRPDRVYRIDPGGAVTVVADDPTGQVLNAPANPAFAGERLDLLVTSNIGGWHLTVLSAPEPGLPLPIGRAL